MWLSKTAKREHSQERVILVLPHCTWLTSVLPVLVLLIWCGCSTASYGDWPTYRGDAARTGHADHALTLPLSPMWTYADTHPPAPAWPRSRRMQFDRAIHAVSLGSRIVMASSVNGSVWALDASSGMELWRFFTAGPVRFAPALWRDLALVASDDGYLYALRLADGTLQWKHRGGPSNHAVLGNQRMISKWPMRGGPVVVDAVVYCAAGIWPSEGIFLYALDARTGDVVWKNTDSGSIEMPQPHPTAVAKSGVSAQGYLVVSGDHLFVPTGRAVPAAFDQHTGRFEYFHLQLYGHNGNSLAMVAGDALFNGGLAFDVQTGRRLARLDDGPIAETGDGVVCAYRGKITVYRWQDQEKPDRKGQLTKTRALVATWSGRDPSADDCTALITARQQVVLGQRGKVSVFDLESQKAVWNAAVDGTVYGLTIANDKLLVSTDQGTVHCFAAHSVELSNSPRDSQSTPAAKRNAIAANVTETAEEIIKQTNVTRGYCLLVGCDSGDLARQLAEQTELHVVIIDPDRTKVSRARKNLFTAGLLGTRISVLQRDMVNSGLPSYFADLIILPRSLSTETSGNAGEAAARLLRPFGGKLCQYRDGKLIVSQRGPLPGIGNWTHQYADPANSVNSGDALVKGPLTALWYRDFDFAIPSRHGRGPAPLFKDGRLFHEGMDGLIAVDAYNGRELWRYDIPGVLKAYDGDELMGVSGTGSNFCVGGDSVYVRDGSRCLRLDANDGSLIGEFQTPLHDNANQATRPPWGYIAWDDGILFGSTANPKHIVTYRYLNRGGDMTRQLTESTGLFAIAPRSGRKIWEYRAKHSVRHNAIAIADGKVFLIDRPIAQFDRQKKPTTKDHPTGTLVALDARTGEQLWQNDENIFGTMLAVSSEHQVLLMSYQPTRFRLDSEIGGRMSGFNTVSGKRLWDTKASYESRPTLRDRTIIAQGGAWDLLTGEPVPFNFKRSYGCGILASSKNMLLFRSATLGYYDFLGTSTTENYGGVRPGCWINALPAGGLVLLPDATSGCKCSYLNRTWIALQPKAE